MKRFGVFLLMATTLASSSVFAAKFTALKTMKSPAAKELAKTVARILKNETTFGDAGISDAYSFTRKDEEENLNTIKQLNHAKAGIGQDDTTKSMQSSSAATLAKYLLDANSQPDDRKAFDRAKEDLEEALAAAKEDHNLEIYGSNHGDEDGSFQILDILDTKNDQVLLLRIGFIGT